MLALNGPQARNILKDLCDDPLDNESFPPYTARYVRIAGLEVLALRMSFAGELGWELHGNAAEAPLLYKALMDSGRKHGLVPAGVMGLLNSLRTEKGFVHYGGEINPAVTPLEVGLAFACKLKADQPDFIGKTAVLAQREKGWSKRLVSVRGRASDAISLWGHEQELLYRDGEVVGALTSGGHSHTLGCAIGLAFVHGPPKVPVKWLKAGSYEVEVPVREEGEVRLKRFPVEVSTRCLVDPEGKRVLGTGLENEGGIEAPSIASTTSEIDDRRGLRV
jgi:4-methylaminobutanoate oxidase (formaldehyde-forming)